MMDEVITRSAPRWAWDLIDETLAMDAKSRAFSQELREEISRAHSAILEEDLSTSAGRYAYNIRERIT